MNTIKLIQQYFPGAAGFEVVGTTVWVRCKEVRLKSGRILPAGNVRLAGSPEKAALEAAIVKEAHHE